MITDELREFMDGADDYELWCPHHKKELLAIADHIDKRYEEMHGFCERLYRATINHKDVTLWDVDYTTLPVDADGEPIHIGDELRDEWHEQNQGEVEWLMLNHHGWWLMLKNNCERFYVHEFHEWHHCHHKQPTVEDVLEELLREYDRDDSELTDGEIIERFAAKLRLAGDAE